MTYSIKESLVKHHSEHQKPDGLKFAYGTAGFRTKADILDSVVFVVGILASLRSKYLDGQTVGVMITASHNPPEDNGIKLIDPQGEMLEQSWEKYATVLANLSTADEIYDKIEKLSKELNIDLSTPSSVIIARDSRDSGLKLTEATIDGFEVMGSSYQNFNLLTTPQLHYLVKAINTVANEVPFGDPTEDGYFSKISTSFVNIFSKFDSGSKEKIEITVDAANGIGGPKFSKLIDNYLSEYIDYELVNNSYLEPLALNVGSGADYVKTNQKLPLNIQPKPLKLNASFDGDADRVIFYYVDENSQFHLLDGDKTSTFLASFFTDLINKSNIDANIGVVQTAYANGSSTKYLIDVLKVPVVCTPTGVKHLHHEAAKFDIGVYFEANGHGTVVFGELFIEKLTNLSKSPDITPQDQHTIETILEFNNLINQTVGDAITDLLAILIVLKIKSSDPAQWDSSYVDLPNKLSKVIVSDRYLFKTTNAERELVQPEGLQSKINEVVKKFRQGRSFVRASGTEDAVRVYSEAAHTGDVEELSKLVSELVENSV
jgi:phosphoacetylglucosamine mutase